MNRRGLVTSSGAMGSNLVSLREIGIKGRLGAQTTVGFEFTHREGSALYGLVATSSTDIILKTDPEGFILHASADIAHLGSEHAESPIGPRLFDLVQPASVPAIREEHAAAVAGRASGEWIEFAARSRDGCRHAFAIRMRALTDERGRVYAVLSIMRSLDDLRSLEEELFNAALTDPLTRLTNRPAFIWMLGHLIDSGNEGCLALFDVDHFKAINLQYGNSVGDQVLIAIAGFLRRLTRPEDILCRVGGETFAVLFPDTTAREVEPICREIVESLSEISHKVGGNTIPLTVSAGAGAFAGDVDNTLRHAELALFFAQAKGGKNLEMENEGKRPFAPWSRRIA